MERRRYRGLMKGLVVLTLFPLAVGCAVQIPTIQRNAVDYNEAIEQMSNEVVFLNVLRAKNSLPRHYTTISSIQGELSFTASAEIGSGLPHSVSRKTTSGGILEPDAVGLERTAGSAVYTPKISTSVSSNPQFTVSILETDEFYKGILSPIQPDTIATYLTQGWSSELVAHLFFESLEFEFSDGVIIRFKNDHRAGSSWRKWVHGIDLTMQPIPQDATTLSETIGELDPKQIAKLYAAGLQVTRSKRPADGKIVTKVEKPASKKLVYTTMFDPRTTQSIEVKAEEVSVFADTATMYANSSDDYRDHLQLISKELENRGEAPDADDGVKPQAVRSESLRYYFGSEAIDELQNAKTHACKKGAKNLCLLSKRIINRSVDGVIYFIGEYLRDVKEATVKSWGESCKPNTKSAEICFMGASEPLVEKHETKKNQTGTALFRIGETPGRLKRLPFKPIIQAEHGNKRYFIPPKTVAEHRSTQILSLIQQLTNLHKKSKDLPQPAFIQLR